MWNVCKIAYKYWNWYQVQWILFYCYALHQTNTFTCERKTIFFYFAYHSLLEVINLEYFKMLSSQLYFTRRRYGMILTHHVTLLLCMCVQHQCTFVVSDALKFNIVLYTVAELPLSQCDTLLFVFLYLSFNIRYLHPISLFVFVFYLQLWKNIIK